MTECSNLTWAARVLWHNLCLKICIFIIIIIIIVIILMAFIVGIGQGRVTRNLEGAPIDRAILVKDTEAVAMVFG